MESIKLRQRVGQDGMLHLDIPVQPLTEQEIEVVVIYQAVPQGKSADTALASFYSVCEDDPIELNEAEISAALDEI